MKDHEQTDLASYYDRRAPVYDAVDDKPERQDDLTRPQQVIPPVFADRDVLKVAAGTGYWTQFIARAARSVLATDYKAAPLAIAAQRDYPKQNTRFDQADAFALEQLPGQFDAALSASGGHTCCAATAAGSCTVCVHGCSPVRQ